MKRFQKWFELIAGISQEDIKREARARQISAERNTDIAALQKPACWSRDRRVGQGGRPPLHAQWRSPNGGLPCRQPRLRHNVVLAGNFSGFHR